MPRVVGYLSGMVLALALAAGPARANLVTNGGFETGDFTGWTLTGSGGGVAIDSTAAHSGTYDAAFALINGGTTATLSQAIATTAGQSYSLSFWLLDQANPSGNDTMTVTFGGFTDAVLWSGLNATSYANVQLTVPGSDITGSSTSLSFQASIDPNPSGVPDVGTAGGPFNLDDIVLTANTAAAPEPPAAWLLAFGVAALGLAARRRRAQVG
jgi:MYXO-CTERM domain-containing protein